MADNTRCVCVCVDDSFQKLESLDPQKRVQLEARIMGRRGSEVSSTQRGSEFSPAQRGSEFSPAQRGSEVSPDKSSSCGASRKRGLNDNHSKQSVWSVRVCMEWSGCVCVCVCVEWACVWSGRVCVCVCVCVEWVS